MGHLFNEENISVVSQGLFNNIQPTIYWSAAEFAPNPVSAWGFKLFGVGNPGISGKGSLLFAWAVRPGDVSATVPEPATAMLLGLGLLGSARRKH